MPKKDEEIKGVLGRVKRSLKSANDALTDLSKLASGNIDPPPRMPNRIYPDAGTVGRNQSAQSGVMPSWQRKEPSTTERSGVKMGSAVHAQRVKEMKDELTRFQQRIEELEAVLREHEPSPPKTKKDRP